MTEGTTRVELARWFIDHDEVDEAARVLAPGDELDLGRSDYLDLAAALSRRGLSASYDERRARVGEAVSEVGLAATPRRPPARSTPVPPAGAKKIA
jgi:hypothetical protein